MTNPPKTEVAPDALPLLRLRQFNLAIAPTYHGVRGATAALAGRAALGRGSAATPADRDWAARHITAELAGEQLYSVTMGGQLWTRGSRLMRVEPTAGGLVRIVRRTADGRLVANDGTDHGAHDVALISGFGLIHPGPAPTARHVEAVIQLGAARGADPIKLAGAVGRAMWRDHEVDSELTAAGLRVHAPTPFTVSLRGLRTLASR
jgi:hypothetical protein